MPRPDKTRITVNGEIDASKTILREGTVIMAARTTRENGMTRKTAGEKAMEGGQVAVEDGQGAKEGVRGGSGGRTGTASAEC